MTKCLKHSKLHNHIFTDEEMECIRVCLKNAPIPYDISLKNIPKRILDKIGDPHVQEHEGETKITMNLSQYE